MTDYERGVEQASNIYREVIREYVAENVKLREQGARLFDKTLELATENAKLRELAAWMYRLMDESCAVQHPYAPEPIRYDTLMDAHEKLRELGVEGK